MRRVFGSWIGRDEDIDWYEVVPSRGKVEDERMRPFGAGVFESSEGDETRERDQCFAPLNAKGLG